MAIVQAAGGTFAGTAFTASLPSLGASSRMVVLVEADTTVTTPAGWTLQKSLVSGAGHYWFERSTAGGATSQAFTTASGAGVWVAYEVTGTFSSAAAAESAASASYTSPAYTPPAGVSDMLVSFVGEPNAPVTYVSMTGGFAKGFNGQAATLDQPLGLAGAQTLAASGSTPYTSTATYSASMGQSGALIGAYVSTPPPDHGPVAVSWSGVAVPGAAAGSSVTTVTVSVAGAPNGDVACIVVGSATTQVGGIAAPTGWNRAGIIDDGNRVSAALLWKVKTAGDTTVAITFGASAKVEAVPFALTGLDTTTPFEGWASTSTQTTSSAALVTPSVTPTTATRQALGVWVARGATAALSPWVADAAMTKAAETGNTVSAFVSVMAALGPSPATQAAHTYASTPPSSYGNAGSALAYVVPASTGATTPHGASTGTATFTGASTGHRDPHATSSGTVAFTGTAAGHQAPHGASSGAVAFTGAAVGHRDPHAASSGSVAFTGGGAGHETPHGAASGTLSVSGTATGHESPHGASSGSAAFTGTGAGHAPVVGGAHGTASGTVAFTGTAAGHLASHATSSGAITFAGSGIGHKLAAGAAVGTVAFTGTAAGHAPTVGAPHGSSAGVVAFTGAAAGHRDPHGLAFGSVTFTGTGSTPRATVDVPTATVATSPWRGSVTAATYTAELSQVTWTTRRM